MLERMHKQTGFSLVEVLIGAVVVAVGLLSVASLHSRLVAQSSDSKARAEAVALAQARMEDMRNYTNAINSRAEFDTEFGATAGFGNETSFDGVNATFTRSEAIGDVGSAKQVQVRVAWTDSANVSRDVTMETRLVWEPPKAVGDIARTQSAPLLPGPTGRARVGEGLVPEGAPLSVMADDGTQIWDDGSGDLKLVVDGRVVLTLLDACQIDEVDGNSCLDFGKINGRVYIDVTRQGSLRPGEVHIVASDASYCQRYYVQDGTTVVVSDTTTSTPTTAAGNYQYFDYRCYVGGGWYGNIGILLSDGIGQTDKVCVGDPTVFDETWKTPRIAARRTYRGMLYREDATTDSGWVEDAQGNPVYFSIGIGDGVELPDPSYSPWAAGASYQAGDVVTYDGYAYRARRDHEDVTTTPYEDSGAGGHWIAIGAHGTHDFVISSLPTSHTAGSYCIDDGVMVRADAYAGGEQGGLFAGMPNDFVCLNPDHTEALSDGYSAPTTCPYPPTNGPALRHIVSGFIAVDQSTESADLISIQTSDGGSACTRGDFILSGALGALVAPYACEVYEWGDGWTGFITVRPNSYEVLCWDTADDGATDNVQHFSGVTADDSNEIFYCGVGPWSLIAGTVTTADLNDTVSAATISSTNGWCTVAADGLSYACVSGLHDGSWTGTITLTTTGGVVCGTNVDSATGTLSFDAIPGGRYEHDIGIIKNANQACPQ